jgi:hypothetical protein
MERTASSGQRPEPDPRIEVVARALWERSASFARYNRPPWSEVWMTHPSIAEYYWGVASRAVDDLDTAGL